MLDASMNADEENGKGDDETDRFFNPLHRQLLVATGPLILICCVGMMMGFPAIVLPQLQSNDSSITITDEEASWIASISILPSCVTCLIGGVLMERYGRRKTQLMICMPFMLGWMTCYMATNVHTLLIGRFLTGLVAGLIGPITNVHISETSEPRYRGFLLCGLSLALAAGTLLEHLLGTFLPWQTTVLICAITPCIGGAFIYFAPESPAWLVGKGKLARAEQAFFWCRGHSPDAKEELLTMLKRRTAGTKARQLSDSYHVFRQMCRKEFAEPLLVTTIFFVTMQWSGTEAISAYAVSFIESSAGTSTNAYTAMLIMDTVHVVISVAACAFCRLYKRRPLILLSGFSATLMMFLLSAFTCMTKYYPQLEEFQAITLICLIGHNVFVNIGLQPLCWTVSGELFPLSLRSYGSAIASSSSYLLLFSVVKTVPIMFSQLGVTGTFMIYGCVTLVGTSILGVILPETKDKTLQEIENYFTKQNRLSNGKTVR